jgi:hypothetical protein
MVCRCAKDIAAPVLYSAVPAPSWATSWVSGPRTRSHPLYRRGKNSALSPYCGAPADLPEIVILPWVPPPWWHRVQERIPEREPARLRTDAIFLETFAEGGATEAEPGRQGPLAHAFGKGPGDDDPLHQAVKLLSGAGGVRGGPVVPLQKGLQLPGEGNARW